MSRTYLVRIGESEVAVTVTREGEGPTGIGTAYSVSVGDGPPLWVDAARPDAGTLSLLLDGQSWEAGLVSTDEGYEVDILGIGHDAAVMDPMRKALRMAAGAGADVIRTAMPGRVVRILVSEGEQVAKGAPVIVVEAMKMENELEAPREGTVARICVSEGDQVEGKTVLVELS
jgi:3-methylcrotonyl-CoA carboxylase alpha subunit